MSGHDRAGRIPGSAVRLLASRVALGLLALLAGTAAAPVAAGSSPFLAVLSPDTAWVDVGDTTTVVFLATESAQHFNAYALTVRFDPMLVDLV